MNHLSYCKEHEDAGVSEGDLLTSEMDSQRKMGLSIGPPITSLVYQFGECTQSQVGDLTSNLAVKMTPINW